MLICTIRITFCATSSLSPTVRVKCFEGAFILSAAVYPPTEEPGAESELSVGKRLISISQEEDGSQQVEVNIICKKLVFEIGWWIYVFVRMA